MKRGDFKIRGLGVPETLLKEAFYVQPAADATLPKGAEVLLEMEVDGGWQPALIRRKCGKGTLYYFLYSPFFQGTWGGEPEKLSRTSLVTTRLLVDALGIRRDTRFGNRGFDLAGGRINVHEKPIHYPLCRDAGTFGSNADEYGEDGENYSGGVFMDGFVSFRGRHFEERGWNVTLSGITSMAAGICSNELAFFTVDPVEVSIRKDGWSVSQTNGAFRVYRLSH